MTDNGRDVNALNKTRQLLIVCNTPSANTRTLAEAALAGAQLEEFQQISSHLYSPFDAGPDEVLRADAVLLGTTENFGYMSGAMKDFLERIYYPCLEKTQGKPFALYVRAGNDGEGARTSIERIVAGLRWRAVQAPLILKGEYCPDFVDQCHDLGMMMAAGTEAGIF